MEWCESDGHHGWSTYWEYITNGFDEAGAIRGAKREKWASTFDFPLGKIRRSDDKGPEGRVEPMASAMKGSVERAPGSRASNGLGWRSPHATVGALCSISIVFGWAMRGELDLTPEEGLGYGLGIAGLSMMVLLLGYSVRKRVRALRNLGMMRRWFEVHLVLGLLGPTLILYHSGFGLGSANATISLFCMLAVSGSGIGGRFLYARMHRGLAGSRRTVKSIQWRAHEALEPIEDLLIGSSEARDLLDAFGAAAIEEPRFPFRIVRVFWMRIRSLGTKYRVIRAFRASGPIVPVGRPVRQAVSKHLSELCRAGELRLFERLFALWHAIHIPLTIILFASAAIHIVAVHLY